MFYEVNSAGALWYENGLSIHYFLVLSEIRGVTDGFLIFQSNSSELHTNSNGRNNTSVVGGLKPTSFEIDVPARFETISAFCWVIVRWVMFAGSSMIAMTSGGKVFGRRTCVKITSESKLRSIWSTSRDRFDVAWIFFKEMILFDNKF